MINEQLGDGRGQIVVNVGAGTGNYEPVDRTVLAVEPSSVMVGQRPPGAAPAVRASGSALPLPSGCADVAMAILTCTTGTTGRPDWPSCAGWRRGGWC